MQKVLTLNQLIEKEYFIVCPFLSTGRFISFCKERCINTSKQQLEQLERLGIFFPIARISRPKIKVKVEYVDNGKQIRRLGILNDGEDWSGDIIEEYAHFWFEKSYLENWFNNGILWDPSARDFEGWSLFYDEEGLQYKENYYSIFQCYSLYNLLRSTKSELHAEWWYTYDEKKIKEITDQISDWAKEVINIHKEYGIRGEKASLISQVLSNRFFPKTQSDRRTIHLSISSDYYNWNWNKYCYDWDSKSVMNGMGISIDELKNLHQIISIDAQYVDPLKNWYELVNFISVEEKKQLKGKALLAQTFYSMEQMIRLFYEDLTGEKLYMPSEGLGFKLENYYGKGVIDNSLNYLEFIANQYHLNPRPKLILVVEGNGEECQFPRLSKDLFRSPFPNLGIEVVNLKGVGGFTGEKRTNKYGALEKFIDYHHNRQTIVYVVLDNEAGTEKTKNKLLKATSKYFSKRFVTKAEYIHIWKGKTIEFENFNDNEIAQAMTTVCGNLYVFKQTETKKCRLHHNSEEGDHLNRLFKEKTGYDLPKRELLEKLIGYIIDNGKKEFASNGEPFRSVVKVTQQIIKLASLNHQPTRFESWEKNQKSGFFGEIKQNK